MSTVIRVATVDDIEHLFDVRTCVSQNHLSREQMDVLGITPQVLAEAIQDGPCVWVAELDGATVAFSMVDQAQGEVFAMFVRPHYENRGLGRLLMAVAEAALFERHDTIFLVTDGRDEVRANGFYRRLGWSALAQVGDGDVRYEKRKSGQ